MKIAAMQPYMFPYIGYLQLMHATDRFFFLDDVHYINKGWINRNRILVNGQDHLFTLPLADASQNRLINTIALSGDEKWRKKFLKTVEMAYKKAPQFANAFPLIERIILHEEQQLSKYIFNSFRELNAYLELKTELLESSSLALSEGVKGQNRILAICESQKAEQYVNAIGGMELYAREAFETKGITLSFIKAHGISYRQFDNDFIPWLSIIDVLMFNPPEAIGEMLGEYELV